MKKNQSFTIDQDVANALNEQTKAQKMSASALVNEILKREFGLDSDSLVSRVERLEQILREIEAD